jgi:hypothetical protein
MRAGYDESIHNKARRTSNSMVWGSSPVIRCGTKHPKPEQPAREEEGCHNISHK